MDIVFLSASFTPEASQLFDYTYFKPSDIRQSLTGCSCLSTGIIVDGPFQRLAQKEGFQEFMIRWRYSDIAQILQKEAVQVGQLVSACLESQPDVLVIADDIAYQRSTYVNHEDLEKHLFTLYREFVSAAHSKGILVLFHSDGNLTDALPGLVSSGFDGLAGCELDCQDIPALKKRFGKQPIFLTGIPPVLLEQEELNQNHRKDFLALLGELAQGDNFVLCSSTGISSRKQLSNLKTLYQWADELDTTRKTN